LLMSASCGILARRDFSPEETDIFYHFGLAWVPI
jgi:hypothetical protein